MYHGSIQFHIQCSSSCLAAFAASKDARLARAIYRLLAMLRVLALCACLTAAVADQCPDDAEVDLCETLGEVTGAGSRNSAWMGLLLPLVSARPKLGATIAVALVFGMLGADAATVM